MSHVTVRDDAAWARHVEDPAVRDRIRALVRNEPLTLLVEGTPVRFIRMRDGRDGRPTDGLRPADEEAHLFRSAMQARRGERVRIALPEGSDSYLASPDGLLSEWPSGFAPRRKVFHGFAGMCIAAEQTKVRAEPAAWRGMKSPDRATG